MPLRCKSDFEFCTFSEFRAGGVGELEDFLSFLSPEQLNKLNKLTIEMKDSSAFIALSSLNCICLNLYFNIFEVNRNLFYSLQKSDIRLTSCSVLGQFGFPFLLWALQIIGTA